MNITIEELLEMIGTLNRFKILDMLREKPLSIEEIAEELNISVPAVLKHLDVLEKAKIIEAKNVRERSEGRPKKVYYLKYKIIPKFFLDEEIAGLEFYIINPKVEEESYDIEDIRMRKALLKVKLRKLEKKRIKLLKELEMLERIENSI
ncbi:MAG: ArsR family transcriptional regulator [Nitrososphaeria archaeon]|nr:ArsR family transcriptional regulator [Nitrososphaeria archaeon]